ncbi:MAG: radical SAM protein [Myxococcaceae bacterium]
MSGRDELLRRLDVRAPKRPAYVVWELTLACDQPCTHCNARAGVQREGELSTAQALEVVKQLAAAGTVECALIGGEAYLHPGFLEIVRALKAAGIRPTMTTGGRGIDRSLAQAIAEAGLHSASVSIDGLQGTHDLIRASKGSFEAAVSALRELRAAGVAVGVNTNLNRLNHSELEALYAELMPRGIGAWQVHLTVPMGRAAERSAMLLQPWDLIELVPRVAALKQRAWAEHRISLQAGNNLGYFGPEEGVLRSPRPDQPDDHYQGCQAGKQLMGIESNGTVKGCPTLQTSAYARGNLKNESVAEVFPRLDLARTVDALWGFCRSCPFAKTCLGGCSFTAHSFFGRAGNNPYCHYRAKTLAARGLRERLVFRQAAAQAPYGSGMLEIIEEPLDAPDPKPPLPRELLKRTHPAAASLRE